MGAMPPERPSDPAARHDGWGTLRRFFPPLWPANNPGLRWRIVISTLLILASMGVTMALPYFLKWAIDAMSVTGPAAFQVALAFVLAYGAGRFGAVMFDNLRNIVF